MISEKMVQGWLGAWINHGEPEPLSSNSIAIAQAFLQQAAEIKQLRAEWGWQDISSAPRDGTRILLWDANRKKVYIGYWETQKYHKKPKPYWEREASFHDIMYQRTYPPTAWQPLPLSKLTDASSSNGRTPDFESGNCGSIPQEAAKLTDSAQRGEE